MKALLLISTMVFCSLAVVCPRNRLQFFSHFSLGKQDELNRTFTAISKNVTFPEVVFNATASQRYRVGDWNITWRYIDSNQKANVSSHDSVIVWGGHLRVDINFNWSLIGSVARNGTGTAYTNTQEISFQKNLLVDDQSGYVMWNLVEHTRIDLEDNKVTLSRINPYNEDDLSNVTKMMNHMINNSGFADLFLEGVNTLMDFHLNNSLHDEHFQQERFTNYTYNHPTKGVITVEYDVLINSALIESNGLHIFTSDVIKNYTNFTCGKAVPNEPLDTQHYGGLQTFLSMGFVESTARWGLANQVYDTDLNEDAWGSHHFQFYAGDLYDVIPALQKKFYPRNKLNGNCKALDTNFALARGSSTTLNVTVNFNCSLNSESSGKILDFSIASVFVITGVAQQRHLDFVVTHADFNATYYQTGEYVVTNKELADYYVNSTSWAVRDTKVFGSNFSVITRDYPHLEISKDEYILIYDSSQIGQKTETE